MNYPYRSQWDKDGSQRVNDCGCACVCMVLEAFGTQTSINEISQEIMPGDQGTTADDLVRALRKRNVNALVWTGTGAPQTPFIALVRYDGFDRANVQDTNFKGWHWMVVLGLNELTAIVHDPDFAGARRNEGDHKRYSRAEFEKAFMPYGQSRIAVVWEETQMTTTTDEVRQAMVTSDMPFLRIRETPGGKVMGAVQNGTAINIIGQGNAPNGQAWYQVRFTTAYPNVFTDESMAQPFSAALTGWVYAGLVTVQSDVPVTTTRPLLGVDVIYSGDAARKVIAAGAKYVAIVGNGQLAKEMKEQHPEVLVSHRGLFYKGHLPSWEEFQQFHGYALGVKDMNVFGTNEEDQITSGDPDSIRKRAEYDWDMFRRCQDIGVHYIAGGFAMGTPDVTRKDIRDALRTHYAPKIAAGMNKFNQHLYTGRTGESNPIDIKLRIYRDTPQIMTIDNVTVNNFNPTWWLERRIAWYIAWCNFPEDTEFWCDEFGMDETPGGFKVHGMSAVEVVAYLRQFVKIHSEPIVVNGVQKRCKLYAAALYQKGNEQNWGSYEITDEYLAQIQKDGAF